MPAKVLAGHLGDNLIRQLAVLQKTMRTPLYLTGGTVRDLQLGRQPLDIDFTVTEGGRRWAEEFSRATGGTYVRLGRDEDAARVVWQGRDLDFSSFREGALTIEQELGKRDVTVNSMAVCLDPLLRDDGGGLPAAVIIDPAGGLQDLREGLIRVTAEDAFRADPLRLLRVYRFAATLHFRVDERTAALAGRQRELLSRVAGERIGHEMGLIMGSDRAHDTVAAMAGTGLLFEVIPELRAGVGMEQPASHHLDVFDHSLAALAWMEKIQQEPGAYFTDHAGRIRDYLADAGRRLQLRWAALLHDLGKPPTLTIDEDRGGRITFYNHDRVGADLVAEVGRRLRWSGRDSRAAAELVRQHMRPFHLGNVRRRGELSLKACLRLIRHVGPLLPGLFVLGMADALAGRGEGRPADMEREIDALFTRIEEVRRRHVEPVQSRPPLVTGRDLIRELGLEPGPVFRELLEHIEEAQMEQTVTTRADALELARACLAAKGGGGR